MTLFHSAVVPGISITNYVHRLKQYSFCSDSCYMLAFIYIDRLLQKNPDFALSRRSVHRVVLTALLLAIKFNDDVYYTNLYYAQVGGVVLEELNRLEAEMLGLLSFDIHVQPQLYATYIDYTRAHFLQLFEQQQQQLASAQSRADLKEAKKAEPQGSAVSMDTVPSNSEIASSY